MKKETIIILIIVIAVAGYFLWKKKNRGAKSLGLPSKTGDYETFTFEGWYYTMENGKYIKAKAIFPHCITAPCPPMLSEKTKLTRIEYLLALQKFKKKL